MLLLVLQTTISTWPSTRPFQVESMFVILHGYASCGRCADRKPQPFQRRTGSAWCVARWTWQQQAAAPHPQAGPRVGAERDVAGLVLVDLGRVDVQVHDARTRCKRLQLACRGPVDRFLERTLQDRLGSCVRPSSVAARPWQGCRRQPI